MNINDFVWVRLTEHGKLAHQNFYCGHGMDLRDSRAACDNTSRIRDWTRFQMWELMGIFGDQMYNGNPHQMFKDNIIRTRKP